MEPNHRTEQLEHKKLTEEELKDYVCSMQTDLHEFRDSLFEVMNEYFDEIDKKIYALKRHFCPEKFQRVYVDENNTTELMATAETDMTFLSNCLEIASTDVAEKMLENLTSDENGVAKTGEILQG